MYAHLYKLRKADAENVGQPYELTIRRTFDLSGEPHAIFFVAGKREANKIAKANGATPWNF